MLSRQFDRWATKVDPELLKSSFSPAHMLAIAAFVLGVIAASELAPAVRAVLGLDAVGLLRTAGPAWAGTVLIAFLWVRGHLTGRGAYVALLIGGGLVAFIAASLVAFASERAAPLMGGLVVMTGVMHGLQARASLRYPFISVVDLVAFSAAALFARGDAQLVVIAISGGAAVIAGQLAGTATLRSLRREEERASLRHALEAQIAKERTERAIELRGIVVDAQARAHDVRNALMGALAAMDEVASDDYRTAPSMARALARAQTALEAAVEIVRPPPARARKEVVALWPEIDAAIDALRPRFGAIDIASSGERGDVLVEVDGGPIALGRVLRNLVLNACEGDGQRRASRVRVIVGPTDDRRTIAISIEDDGPGFSAVQLAGPITGFHTTKAEGTGLGLFTVERLVGASGGWVERENARGGGAIVRVVLPRVRPERAP